VPDRKWMWNPYNICAYDPYRLCKGAWHLRMTQAPAAWGLVYGTNGPTENTTVGPPSNEDVTIAVLDNGSALDFRREEREFAFAAPSGKAVDIVSPWT